MLKTCCAAAIVSLVVSLAVPTAGDSYTNGSLEATFDCPGKQCITKCVGPGGPQSFTGYSSLKAYILDQADRLWLDMDDTTFVILGVGDRCEFGGTGFSIKPRPGGSVSLPGFSPAVICIGTQCR